MPIAKTKAELLEAMETEHQRLMKVTGEIAGADFVAPGACHHWSCKDMLAHLVEWKQMFLGWYAAGLRGENPRTPAEDLNWTQTPALNARIYERWKNVPLEVVRREFDAAYAEMLGLARGLSEEDLFRKQLYSWMRAWPLARWIAANTSSHYRWAGVRMKRWAKKCGNTISVRR